MMDVTVFNEMIGRYERFAIAAIQRDTTLSCLEDVATGHTMIRTSIDTDCLSSGIANHTAANADAGACVV